MLRLVAGLVVLATPAMADPEGWGHMYGYGVGMMLGPVLWSLVLGLTVVGVIWLIRRFDDGSSSGGNARAAAELDLRFARGEIDADEYSSRKKLLGV